MSAPTLSRVAVQAARFVTRRTIVGRSTSRLQQQTLRSGAQTTKRISPRCFTTSIRARAGLMPESEDPQPPSIVEKDRVLQPTQLDDDEYQLRSDEYMDAIHERAEEMQEERADVEVEYSAGVLSLTLPEKGTYILNKQPPNKQIWLSSPISGPKRFDWVVDGESMHEKEGGGQGDWVYLRDGTSLEDICRKELGITLDIHGHEQDMKAKPDLTSEE